MLGAVELIVDDRRLRSRLTGGREKVGLHIHHCSLNHNTLFRRQRGPQRHRLGGIESLHYLQHPVRLRVGHQRHVRLATEETLLVQPDPPGLLGRTPRQPARHRSIDQLLQAVLVQPQQLSGLRH